MPPNPTPPSGNPPNQFQLEKIWRTGCLLDALCDPGKLETHAAVTLAQQMMERYRDFDTRLVAELMAVPDVAAGNDRRIERCLEILDAVSVGRRIVMPLRQLANAVNPRVRSKVAGILGRRIDNLAWARKFKDENDGRTRANLIESLWGSDSLEIREVLWMAVRDTNNRVRGNAILALYRLGVAGVLPEIRELSESQTANCRATAAWVMGATGDPRFQGVLKALRQDAEQGVRAAALRGLVQINKSQEGQANLEPQICFAEDLEGVRRVGFDLPEGAPPRSLFPTDVVLTANGELVWDYQFVERRSSPLSALFLIFDGTERDELAGLAEAFAESLERKDKSDRWSIVHMVTGPEGASDGLKAVLPLYQGLELKKAITRFGKLPRIQVQELPQAIRLLGTSGPGRHLVLLHTAGALSDADLESLELLAIALNLIVDVISFGSTGNERLQKIARQTDGVFISAPAGAISPEWMVQAYASLVHRYEVTYSLTASNDSVFEITIASPRPKGALSGGPSAIRSNTPAA
jgi:hypothetical protein